MKSNFSKLAAKTGKNPNGHADNTASAMPKNHIGADGPGLEAGADVDADLQHARQ